MCCANINRATADVFLENEVGFRQIDQNFRLVSRLKIPRPASTSNESKKWRLAVLGTIQLSNPLGRKVILICPLPPYIYTMVSQSE